MNTNRKKMYSGCTILKHSPKQAATLEMYGSAILYFNIYCVFGCRRWATHILTCSLKMTSFTNDAIMWLTVLWKDLAQYWSEDSNGCVELGDSWITDMDYHLNRVRMCKKFCHKEFPMKENGTEKEDFGWNKKRWLWAQMDASDLALDHADSTAAFLLLAIGSCVRCPSSARFCRDI